MGSTKVLDENGGSVWEIPVAKDVVGMRILIANIYFIGTHDDWFLVDGGMTNRADDIQRAAESRFGIGARPRAIVLTHGHFDHVGAVKTLAERWNVPVYAHELELPYLTGRSKYPPADPTVSDSGLMGYLSFMYPRTGENLGELVQKFPDNDVLSFNNEWKIVSTPGHTPGHISLFRESDGVFIAGDAIVTTKPESAYSSLTESPQQIRRPPAYFTPDWVSSAESVRKIAALKPETVATGHGKPMSGTLMKEQLEELARNFESNGKPSRGRYVNAPAIADKNGVVSYPPVNSSQIGTVVSTAIIAVSALALLAVLTRKRA
ncbi:MAG: MBL fold metallo-hydrolase [Pyrinomonadaceae bacterium]|nr:MBL fold metallo-hydrolase [Pyrinomonadaceae bacterium]